MQKKEISGLTLLCQNAALNISQLHFGIKPDSKKLNAHYLLVKLQLRKKTHFGIECEDLQLIFCNASYLCRGGGGLGGSGFCM